MTVTWQPTPQLLKNRLCCVSKCCKPLSPKPCAAVQLLVYVDGVAVGETATGEPTPHLLINRLCEGQTSESDPGASQTLGFSLELPPLQHGRHQARDKS